MKKKQQRSILEWALLAAAFVVGVRMAAPLMGETSATAFDLSDMANWTGQVVPGDVLDTVLPLRPLTEVTDTGAVMSSDVTTLQSQLTEANDRIKSLEDQVRLLQDQLSIALSGNLAQAEPLRFADDGTPYAAPISPSAQSMLCMYFNVGC